MEVQFVGGLGTGRQGKHSGAGGGVSRRIHGSVHDLAVVSLCCSVVCPRQAKHESEASGPEGIACPSLMDRWASVALCETVIVYRECGKDATALRGLQKRVAEGEGLWGAASDPSVWSAEGHSERRKARCLEL